MHAQALSHDACYEIRTVAWSEGDRARRKGRQELFGRFGIKAEIVPRQRFREDRLVGKRFQTQRVQENDAETWPR